MKTNPWSSKFNFYWYNDEELFHFTDDDFDAKAKKLCEDGVDIVITFSCTHFRWTFRSYWDQINRTLKKVVDSCHKYGIKVVEHHSSHLTFGPRNEEEYDYMGRILKVRQSKFESWPGIRDYVLTDPEINGKPISSFRQIDGSTDEPVRSNYKGWSMCFNNPDYRKAYFSYLETLYAIGIDGIMTDDVQYNANACACEHCRKLFKEQTGYELPNKEHWSEFYDNYNDPVYIAWRRFKYSCTEQFQRNVNTHFKSLGYDMIRPNYISNILNTNWSFYPFEECADLWDYIFQENCFSNIIGPSFPAFFSEALHRFAMGRAKNVPSMSMYYPGNPSAVYLAWALSRVCGQMYLGTCEGFDMSTYEKPYRDFENKYAYVYTAPKKAADIAFYLSRNTRDFVVNERQTMRRMISRMNAAFLSGIQADLLFPTDSDELFSSIPVIMLCNAIMLSDEEIEKLSKYLRSGGRLLIEGECGTICADGSKRSINVPAALAGIGDVKIASENEVFAYGGLGADRWANDLVRVNTPPYMHDTLRRAAAETMVPFLKTNRICLDSSNSELLPFFYFNDDSYIVQLCNTDGLIPKDITVVDHSITYPNFEKNAVCNESPITVTVERCDDRIINTVLLASPEFDKEINVPFTDNGTHITFTVPAGTFAGYLLVILQ